MLYIMVWYAIVYSIISYYIKRMICGTVYKSTVHIVYIDVTYISPLYFLNIKKIIV